MMRKRLLCWSSPWSAAWLAVAAAVLLAGLCPLSRAGAGSSDPGTPLPETPDSGGAGDVLPLSLQHSVLLALENNREIRIERLNPLMRGEEVKREAGAFFAPRMTIDVSTDRTLKPAGTVLAGAQVAQTENVDLNTGVSLRSTTGGVVSLDLRNRRTEINSAFQLFDPQYTSDLALTLTHPLLKNFGIGVNRTKIRIAQNNLEMSRQQLAVTAMNLVTDVQQAYWDLVLAGRDVAARRRSLAQAQHLEERATDMVAAGRLPAIALLQTKAGVVEREIDLVGAENTLEDAQAHLRALLNLDRLGAPTTVVIVPTDTPPAEVKGVSVEEGLKAALENRPELSQAKLDQENRELSVKLARNQTLPELNVVGSVGLSGLSGRQNPNSLTEVTFAGRTFGSTSSFQGGPDDALESMLSGDFLSYKVGLTLQLPLGNQSARSELQRARLEAQKGRLSLETVQQRIALEVERLARGMKASIKAMDGIRAFLDLAAQKLRMVQEGLDLGASSVTDVLEAQKNLILAERDALRVLIEYHKLYVMWEKVTGVTLERFQITL